MQWLLPALIATAANSAILACVYLYLSVTEKQRALLVLAAGWGMYVVRFLFMIAWVLTGKQLAYLLILNQAAMLASAALLLAGTLAFTGRRLPRWVCYVLAAGLLWIIIAGLQPVQLWHYSLPTFTIVGAAFFWIGAVYLKAYTPHLPEAQFVGWAFIIWGVHKLDYPLLRPVEWFVPWGYLIGAALAIVCAIGIVLIYFQLAKRDLAASRERYSTLVEKSPTPILVHTDGVFVSANSAAVRLMAGEDTSQIVGHRVRDFLSPTQFEYMWEMIGSQEEGSYSHRSYELEVNRLDGGQAVIDVVSLPIEFEQRISRLVFCRDVTESRAMEEQLRQSHKLEAIGTLAGGIAHDFNNILFAIQGFAEMAKLESAPGSKPGQYLGEILKACQRASALIRQILTFARSSKREPGLLEPQGIVKEVLKLLRATLPTSIAIEQSLDAGQAALLADPAELHQVVMNLCTNAAHAMSASGGTLAVRLSVASFSAGELQALPELSAGDYFLLEVSDTGTGIAAQHLPRIFEPFYTTRQPGEGTGLGLSVTHGLVTSMGGGIAVESEEGSGSTFRVYLPTTPAEAKAGVQAQSAQLPGSGVVYIVDDEPALSELLGRMLGRLGYEARTFTSPQKLLDGLGGPAPACDLVLTDLTMPDMTGFELAAEVKRLHPGLPVILISGYIADQAAAQSEPGVDHVIPKPVNIVELSQALATVLHNRGSGSAAGPQA